MGNMSVTSAGGSIPQGMGQTTGTRVRITPENFREVLGPNADVLLTPQDTKALYEKGYMDVQRQFNQLESNEGIASIASKFAAALVGPSRSVGALTIDPMFLEMIKDPNAEVGFGYTRVKNETLKVLPYPAAEPAPPEAKPPVRQPVLQTVDPYEITRKKREESDVEMDKLPTTTTTPVNKSTTIAPLPQPKGYVSNSTVQAWMGFARGNHDTTHGDTEQLAGLQELAGSPIGNRNTSPAVVNYTTGLLTRQYTGETAYVNLVSAEEMQGTGSVAWTLERMSGTHTTQNSSSTASQESGNLRYNFAILDTPKKQPLTERSLERYAQLTGKPLAEVKSHQPPYNEADMLIAITTNSTLGNPSGTRGTDLIPEASASVQEDAAGVQKRAKQYAATVFGKNNKIDVSQLSLQDYKALQLLAGGSISRSEAAKVLTISPDGTTVTLNNTPEALAVLRGISIPVTDGRKGNDGKPLRMPLAPFVPPQASVQEVLAGVIYASATNYADKGGVGQVMSLTDTQDVLNNTIGKMTPEQRAAAGITPEQFASLQIDRNDGALVKEGEGGIFRAAENVQDAGRASAPTSLLANSIFAQRPKIENALIAQTQASTVPPLDIPQAKAQAAGQPEKVSVLNDLQSLRNITAIPHTSTEYNRRAISQGVDNIQTKINKLKENNPNDPDIAKYQTELNRVRDLDNAKRGQLIQMGGGGGAGSPAAVSTVTSNIGNLNQAGLIVGPNDSDAGHFVTMDKQISDVIAANPAAKDTLIPGMTVPETNPQTGEVTQRPAKLSDWGSAASPGPLRQKVLATAMTPVGGASTVAADAGKTVVGNIGKINKPEQLNSAVAGHLATIDAQVAQLDPNKLGDYKVTAGTPPQEYSLKDWGTATQPGPLRKAVEQTAMQQPAQTDATGPLTNDESASRVAGNLSRLETIGANDAIAPGTTKKIEAHIKADIDKLKAMPADTKLTITNPDGTTQETTAGELLTRYETVTISAMVAETKSAGAVTDALAQTGKMADDFQGYVKKVLADGKVTYQERADLQATVNQMSMDLATQLKGKIPGFENPGALTPADIASQLKAITPEQIQAAGLPDGLITAIDKVNTCQACVNVAAEGNQAAELYKGVRNLNQRLDEFQSVEVVKTAFRGEMKKYAEMKDPAMFNAMMAKTYQIDPTTTQGKAAIDSLREQAKAGTLPIPPNIRFVDRSELGGANGAYAPNIQDNQGRNLGPAILLSRDLLTQPDLMRDVFTEEMFHHLEKTDAVKSGLNANPEQQARIASVQQEHDQKGMALLQAMAPGQAIKPEELNDKLGKIDLRNPPGEPGSELRAKFDSWNQSRVELSAVQHPDAKGDEGRAGLFALRAMRAGETNIDQIGKKADEGRDQVAQVSGNITRSASSSDQGVTGPRGIKGDDFTIPPGVPIEFNSGGDGNLIRSGHSAEVKPEDRVDLGVVESQQFSHSTTTTGNNSQPYAYSVRSATTNYGYSQPIQLLNPQETMTRVMEAPEQIRAANLKLNNLGSQLQQMKLPGFESFTRLDVNSPNPQALQDLVTKLEAVQEKDIVAALTAGRSPEDVAKIKPQVEALAAQIKADIPAAIAAGQTGAEAQMTYDGANNFAAQLKGMGIPAMLEYQPINPANPEPDRVSAAISALSSITPQDLQRANPSMSPDQVNRALTQAQNTVSDLQRVSAANSTYGASHNRGNFGQTSWNSNFGTNAPVAHQTPQAPQGGSTQSAQFEPEGAGFMGTVTKVLQPLGRGLQQMGAQLMNIMDAQLEKLKQLWYGPNGVLSNLQSSILAHDVIYGKGGGHGHDADAAVGREDQRDGKDRNHSQRASGSFTGVEPDYAGIQRDNTQKSDEYTTKLYGANKEILDRKKAAAAGG